MPDGKRCNPVVQQTKLYPLSIDVQAAKARATATAEADESSSEEESSDEEEEAANGKKVLDLAAPSSTACSRSALSKCRFADFCTHRRCLFKNLQ